MFNTKNKIHDYVLPLILCALGSTGCVTQKAPIVILSPSPAASGATTYVPYIPPSAAPSPLAASAPATTPTTAAPATAAKPAPAATATAGVVIPAPGKSVYQLPAAPGEPTQYIVVDAVRPPVASE